MINYEYYKVFYYVAKNKSISQAAIDLGNNQPNITRIINRLEEDLGSKLFYRSNRGVSLTRDGEDLFSHIEIAVKQIIAGEKELEDKKNMKAGHISIACTETALNLYLLDKLRVFREKYPDIQIHITNHTTPQAMYALKTGEVDCAVVTSPTTKESDLNQCVLAEFREILICGERYRLCSENAKTLQEISQLPVIMLGEKTATRKLYSQLFMNKGLQLVAEIEVATADQILPMVINNLGIGFVPENIAQEALIQKKVFQIPLVTEIPKREIILFTSKARSEHRVLNEFIAML